jgi:hypothetical protein
MFAIRDNGSREYYRKAYGPNGGWYGSKLDAQTRLFDTKEAAERTIAAAGHHVSYPGGRDLYAVPVRLVLGFR